MDAPTELPEGMELELVAVAENDEEELDADDRARLVAAIREGLVQVRRGEGISSEDLLAKLRANEP